MYSICFHNMFCYCWLHWIWSLLKGVFNEDHQCIQSSVFYDVNHKIFLSFLSFPSICYDLDKRMNSLKSSRLDFERFPFRKQLYDHATPFGVIYRLTLRHIICSELMGNNCWLDDFFKVVVVIHSFFLSESLTWLIIVEIKKLRKPKLAWVDTWRNF